MRIVTLEEHISLPQFDNRISKEARMKRGWPDPGGDDSPVNRVKKQLEEVGDEIISDMDACGITMQVLSVTAPGGDILENKEAVNYVTDYNNEIANIIAKYPQRFAAFAVLPMAVPQAAADELQRDVTGLKFCGTMINGTTHDKFLDDIEFEPILSVAE